jgi:hypothetical protein
MLVTSCESRVSAALSRITSSYTAFLKDESNLPTLVILVGSAVILPSGRRRYQAIRASGILRTCQDSQ